MPEAPTTLDRLPTGVPGLDAILAGGFVRGCTYLIVGAPGTGKTILTNQIGFNLAAAGQSTTYFTLYTEQHSQMFSYLSGMDFYNQSVIAQQVGYFNTYKVYEEEGLKGLLQLIRGEQRRQRSALLILDGFPRFDFLNTDTMGSHRFIQELQGFGFTSRCVILVNMPPAAAGGYRPEHMLVDGIIEMRHETAGNTLIRTATIEKFRGSTYQPGAHSFSILPRGLVFNDPAQ